MRTKGRSPTMRFTGTLRAAHRHGEVPQRAGQACLRETIAQGLMEWLEATVIAEVPVWSGAVAGHVPGAGPQHRIQHPDFSRGPQPRGHGMSESSGSLEAERPDGRLRLHVPDDLAVADHQRVFRRHAMGLPSEEARPLPLSDQGAGGLPQVCGKGPSARSVRLV